MPASFYVPPTQQRSLRACMVCSIVMPYSKFHSEGCPNCDFLEMQGSQDIIQETTSQVFEGLIMVGDPKTSWVAKWNRLDGYVSGTYATKVQGTLADEYADRAEAAGVKYIPRDGTKVEEE